ncbi:glycosyltransferase [archaeon]|nr:glycosyltransferase [archaeon]
MLLGGLLAVLVGLLIGVLTTLAGVRPVRFARHHARCKSWPYVSVLVPAYNEEKVITRCLDSILEQDYPHFEVIVIAGGEDRTFELAQQYLKRGVAVIPQPRRGKAYALNLGLAKAQGEVIVTVDADCRLPKEWLKQVVAPLVIDPDVAAVGGWSRPTNPKGILVACLYAREAYESVIRQRELVVLPGFGSAYRASALKEVGGFNERVYMLIDYEVQQRLAARGFRFLRSLDAVLYREYARRLRDYVKQQLRWVRGMFRHSLRYERLPFLTRIRIGVRPLVYTLVLIAPLALLIPAAGFLWIKLLWMWGSLLYIGYALGKMVGAMFAVSKVLGDRWLLNYLWGAVLCIFINMGIYITAFFQEIVGWRERVTFDVEHLG